MVFFIYGLLFLMTLGLAGVASNPSPHYAALSLVIVAGSGCALLVCLGSSFLSFILFFVYLGGMLVVFAYSIAFASSFNLNNLESYPSIETFIIYITSIMMCFYFFVEQQMDEFWVLGGEIYSNFLIEGNVVSVAFLYKNGGGLLILGCLALLTALLAVLFLVRGATSGALRAV